MQIIKRNGNTAVYDDQKIIQSILKANDASSDSKKITENAASSIAYQVVSRLAENSSLISTSEIREGVYEVLCERGFDATAKTYIDYKKAK